MKVTINSMVWFPKAEMSEADLILLRRRLTLIPKSTSEYKNPEPIEMFHENESAFGVPREYYFAQKSLHHTEVDDTELGCDMNTKLPRVPLKSYQRSPQDIFLEHYRTKYGACLCAETGYGKTIMGLSIARELGRSTLIIVHKTTLGEQWRARITGDPNEESELLRAGFFPEAKVGFVGDGECTFEGCDFVIALVQSLYDKNLPDKFYKQFGLIIGDEIHRMGSSKWSRAIPRFPARYRLGLSATPRRKDNAEDAFFFHLGKILFHGKGQVLVPTVYRVHTRFSFIETPNFNENDLRKDQFIESLINSDYRNNIIVNELVSALTAGRRVLCVSDRVAHLENLKQMLELRLRKEGKFYTIGEFFKGGRKISNEDLNIEKRKEMVFGTYKLIEDGEDVQDLDTLFMATPLSDAEQIIGRILRVKEGKKSAIVIDVVDPNVGRCSGLSARRMGLYTSKEWKVYDVKKYQ